MAKRRKKSRRAVEEKLATLRREAAANDSSDDEEEYLRVRRRKKARLLELAASEPEAYHDTAGDGEDEDSPGRSSDELSCSNPVPNSTEYVPTPDLIYDKAEEDSREQVSNQQAHDSDEDCTQEELVLELSVSESADGSLHYSSYASSNRDSNASSHFDNYNAPFSQDEISSDGSPVLLGHLQRNDPRMDVWATFEEEGGVAQERQPFTADSFGRGWIKRELSHDVSKQGSAALFKYTMECAEGLGGLFADRFNVPLVSLQTVRRRLATELPPTVVLTQHKDLRTGIIMDTVGPSFAKKKFADTMIYRLQNQTVFVKVSMPMVYSV